MPVATRRPHAVRAQTGRRLRVSPWVGGHGSRLTIVDESPPAGSLPATLRPTSGAVGGGAVVASSEAARSTA
jgi:hypothetical protein